MKKRFLSALLAFCMVLALCPTVGAANIVKSGQCGSNATWTQDSDGILTISGTGPMKNYDVIMNWSPWHMGSAKAIKISEGITTIGSAAFGWMFSLKTIEIPKSVVAIGSDAFNNSRMITDIYYAGTESDWNNIKIYSGNYTLDNATIHFGSNVSNEKSGICGPQLQWTLTSDGTLIISGTGAMDDFTGGGDGTAPWYTDRKNIKAVIVENGVTNIGYCAFWDCTNIMTIQLPNSLTRIGGFAFALCTSLREINIPSSTIQIDFSAFGACYALTKIIIPDDITKIEEQTFAECTGLREITIPSGVTSIGDTAFWKCPGLTDVYYSGNRSSWDAISIGNENEDLLNATIHCNDNSEQKYKVYCNGSYEVFDISLETCMNETASIQYNPLLSHMLIAMCNSVYSREDMEKTFESQGFSGEPSIERKYITYSVGKKYMEDGTPLVLVAVKGTGPLPWEENSDTPGWKSNVWGYISTSGDLHSGYADAANEVYTDIRKILGNDVGDFSSAKFVLTGFSRGAATANVLAKKLTDDKVAQSHIYAYTFACPDVTKNKYYGGYDCIFNIADVEDFVSWTPSGSLEGVFSGWNKFGRSYWFSNNWDSLSLEMGINAHDQTKYLKYLGNEERYGKDTLEFKRRDEAKKILDEAADRRHQQFWTNIQNGGYKQIGDVIIACPVDVEVYASGKLVGSITDNLANVIDTGKIFISVVNDRKEVYLLDNDAYTFNLTATGTGTMDYTIQNIDVKTKTVSDKRPFENVSLFPEKEFTSTVTVVENAVAITGNEDAKLYVVGNKGTPEKEVLPDGSGTEVPVGQTSMRPVTFSDVPSGAYFYDAVLWAVNRDITTGTTSTKFSPGQTCTSAEILTFLWRAAGKPKSSAQLPITVPATLSYAEDAIRWAAEKGMVDRNFNPKAPCTRASAVTYIWQAFNRPAANSSGFSDVPASASYSQAVAWAVKLGITNGTGNNRFTPNKICNRGEIVTFLHRAYVPEVRLTH